jgi:integrase
MVAIRPISLDSGLHSRLCDFVMATNHQTESTAMQIAEVAKRFLFCTRTGRPVSPSNIIRRHLQPALKKLKYVNMHTGTHKARNHAFRRFRNTFLRNYTDCPEGLYKYWLGHAGKDMSDLYDKIKEGVLFRKKWAGPCGFGFELPSVVPSIPKCRENAEAAVAT